MYSNKKFIVCTNCLYFPTKIDSLKNNSLVLLQKKIIWKCEACFLINIYDQTQSIMLPQIHLIKTKQNNILLNQDILYCANYLILIDCTSIQWDKIVYCPPFDRKIIQCKLNKDLSELKTYQQLSSQSKWLNLYLCKKAALNKFSISNHHKNKRSIKQGDYIIHFIEMYLRNVIVNKQSAICKFHIKLIDKSLVYSFQLSDNFTENNTQLSQFLQIYALLACKFQPPWLQQVFRSVIQKHTIQETEHNQYSAVLLINTELQQHNISRNTLRRFMNQNQINQMNNSQKIKARDKLQMLNSESQLIFYPLNQNYCYKSLNLKTFADLEKIQQLKWQQKILIYFQYEGQTTISIYQGTLKENKLLKTLLLRCNSMTIQQQQKLSQAIRQMINSKSIYQIKSIIKMYARIKQNQEYIIIMFTFNWNQIYAQFIQLLQDAPNYYTPFLSDNYAPNEHFRQQIYNPFFQETTSNSLNTPFTSTAHFIRKTDQDDIYI